MPRKSSSGEDGLSFDSDGGEASQSNSSASYDSANNSGARSLPIKKISAKLKQSRFGILLAVIVLLGGSSFSIGYLVSENQHPISLVDQAIARVSSGDPHSPTEILLQRAAIQAVLKATKDRWSNYFPPATATAFDQILQGRYSGIGIWLRRTSLNTLEISGVQPKSPASLAGIKVSDQLLSVDGVDVSNVTVADAIATLRGSASTQVTLGLLHNGAQISLNIVREAVLTGDVLASQIATNTLYIQVSAISQHAAQDVATALAKYPHSRGVILDLRDNPGGVLNVAVDLASEFLSPGPIVSYDRKGGSPQEMSSTNTFPETAPMVVLINGATASSSEIIAGALQDRNRAVIIGDQSYGKGTVQEISELSDGSQLEITVGQYHLPSGRAIDQVGITPDLKVSESHEIAQAVSILAGLVALDSGKPAVKK